MLEESLDGKLFFPPELVPVVAHPLLRERGDDIVRRVLLHRLHVYLGFTAELEQLAINPVTQLVSRGKYGFALPEQMFRDAYKICTDESWHAQFSDDLQQQIVMATGELPVAQSVPRFLRKLDAVRAEEPAEIRGLGTLFFTVVSETLISSILCKIPGDDRVVSAVRETVADHAEDEGRHHAYYATFFELVWPQLSRAQRELAGPLLPVFIDAFLSPDLDALRSVLSVTGLNEDEIRGVVEESHPPTEVMGTTRAAARSTVRLLERNGVFEDARTYDAFAQYGLEPTATFPTSER
jgi:hypothetical protein